MLNPISVAFIKAKQENRPALLTYTVAGDSSKKQSLNILKSISKNADILEVGVPHNTPVADGSQIQTSAYRAIKNGIKVNDIFKIVKDFKKFDKNKPIILMGYYNMIFQYDENKFLNKCKLSGVNGLIVVDLPWPENKDFAKKCKKKSVNINLSPFCDFVTWADCVGNEKIKLLQKNSFISFSYLKNIIKGIFFVGINSNYKLKSFKRNIINCTNSSVL